MSETKTRATAADVAAFLDAATAGNDGRRRECDVLSTLLSRLTGCPPVMWGPSIVGFGHLEVGLLVLILAPECYTPFREFGAAYHASRAGVAALERVTAIVDAPLAVRAVVPASTVSASHFTVTYPTGTVVAPVSFSLPPVGITALLGASGTGKSTLLRALAGRLDAEAIVSGELAGIDADRIAGAPQHPRAVESTVRAELELYALGPPVDDLLTRLGLAVVADSDPESEWREAEAKARAVLTALGLAAATLHGAPARR